MTRNAIGEVKRLIQEHLPAGPEKITDLPVTVPLWVLMGLLEEIEKWRGGTIALREVPASFREIKQSLPQFKDEIGC